MRGRRPLVAAVLLLGGLLAVPAPAHSEAILRWSFEERPDGLPATAEPARTLASGYAALAIGRGGSRLSAPVELAGVPTAETGSELHLRIGTVDESGACVTDWELVVPTLDPSGLASREGTTLQVAASMGLESIDLRCAAVSLVAADGALLDRLEDDQSGLIIADPGAMARIKEVTGRQVRPHHWSTVWVRVGHRGAEADGVRVTAAGAGVRVRGYTARLTLHQGDEVWAPLRVKLLSRRTAELRITARPFGYLAFVFPGTREVLLRPTRGDKPAVDSGPRR